MEIKRLRKSKTVRTEDMRILTETAKEKIAKSIRSQQLEIMRISDDYREECSSINGSCNEIMRVSHNLSGYFSAVAGVSEIKPKKTDFCEYTKYLCDKAAPYAEKFDIRILCKTPKSIIIVNIDRENFSYAFFDVLRNAMEYSPAKSKIKVTLQKLSKFAKITVEDKGEGMDEETFFHCAEPLFSGKKPNGENGMGLGLCLAEHFINESGGRVKIISEKGAGTSVSFFLPLCENEEDIIAAKDCKIMRTEGKYIPAEIVFSGMEKKDK